MKKLYETTVINTGGRKGEVHSPDNIFFQDIASPKELGGEGGSGSNPEQLFAAGYSACFNSALELVMSKQKNRSSEHGRRNSIVIQRSRR
ncbi:putative organic hydroperoxide resistance protein OhrA [Listeria cornellensis FSL F6-0969]|uniref:Putative organic hydroperoxide resistance protein OhrA n=1 Tax=Listeria cornellensis FSL F6-0969 TaxID=1265820 RepID=W7CBB5_9LIST|nr:putative organic hydroperoxide resistance protein OhrA [Listeria cornellensis FSL F6-0969]